VPEDPYWWVYPNTRKPISLLKIPKYVEEEMGIKDGKPLMITITGVNGEEYFRGPVTVTSGCEIYLPNNVKEMLKGLRDVKITLV